MNLPPLTSYEQVVKLTKSYSGASIPSLVRLSHIHLFGIAFILFFVGKLFVLCEAPVFAYLLVLSGAIMGLSLNFQVLISLYKMWLPISYYQIIAAKLKTQGEQFRQFALFSDQPHRCRRIVGQGILHTSSYLFAKVSFWFNRERLRLYGDRLRTLFRNLGKGLL